MESARNHLHALLGEVNHISQESELRFYPTLKKKKGPTREPFDHLVAGARYVNYMLIEIDPFPLVA